GAGGGWAEPSRCRSGSMPGRPPTGGSPECRRAASSSAPWWRYPASSSLWTSSGPPGTLRAVTACVSPRTRYRTPPIRTPQPPRAGRPPPAGRGPGEEPVGGADAAVRRDPRRGDVSKQHPSETAPVGEVQVAERARRRIEVCEEASQRGFVQGGVDRILEVPRI